MRNGPSKSGRSWAKVDGHGRWSTVFWAEMDGHSYNRERSRMKKVDGPKVLNWTAQKYESGRKITHMQHVLFYSLPPRRFWVAFESIQPLIISVVWSTNCRWYQLCYQCINFGKTKGRLSYWNDEITDPWTMVWVRCGRVMWFIINGLPA